MIKTAGRFVTESELRTYTKCSQLHFYQGKHNSDPRLPMMEYAFEALTSHSVRKDIMDPLHLMQKYLYRAILDLNYQDQYMEQQVKDFQRESTLRLSEVFNLFSFATYLPVFGPIDYNVQVGKTPVTLHVSGLYRSAKNQTMHIVCFSPYDNEHAMLNDPSTQLKLQTLKQVVKPHYTGRIQAKLHLFGLSPTEQNLIYTSMDSGDVNKQTIKQIKLLVQGMETGFHFPLVPCPYQCKFRRICYPEKQ